MRRIKLWRKLSTPSRLSTDPWYIRNATAIFLTLHEIVPLFAELWETPASELVPENKTRAGIYLHECLAQLGKSTC